MFSAGRPRISRYGNESAYDALSDHARLRLVLRLFDNHLFGEHTVWQGQSNQCCIKPLNSSHPSALLYTNTSALPLHVESGVTLGEYVTGSVTVQFVQR